MTQTSETPLPPLPFGLTRAPAPKLSFEFFPPKTDEMAEKLWTAILRLAPLRPRFVSVTYGAGGSTRELTHDLVERIKTTTDTP
ncbi:MAG: methylenetetrahydrofolate reductase, partial [Alphaproteobacteria bacterium]